MKKIVVIGSTNTDMVISGKGANQAVARLSVAGLAVLIKAGA